MPRRVQINKVPTETEIRKYSNVPVDVAAKFLGASTVTIKRALQDGRAPFGFAALNPETGWHAYQISPERLIRYQSGELPMYSINDIMHYAAAGIEDILEEKTRQMTHIYNNLMG